MLAQKGRFADRPPPAGSHRQRLAATRFVASGHDPPRATTRGPSSTTSISGKNNDSLVYDVRNKLVYIYNKGDVTYQNSNLKADYMRIDMDSKMVYAYGKPDTLDGKDIVTKPEFTEGSATYQMDTITYNLDSKKAKIKGVATQEGDGWLIGGSVKKMPDNTINIQDGKYTTCDHTDHPHFYLAMTKAKVIPGKKVITGPAYLVLEDVPIYFLGIPEGFFPLNRSQVGPADAHFRRGVTKGFYIRDLGYYFTLGDYADLAVRGGFYTLGSWEASAASRYINATSTAAVSTCSIRISRRERKANPTISSRATSASSGRIRRIPRPTRVHLLGLGKLRHQRLQQVFGDQPQRHSLDADQLVDRLLEELAGNTFSLSANMAVSQNSQSGTLSVTLPTLVFNVSLLPLQTQGEKRGQGAVVRKDLDAVYG